MQRKIIIQIYTIDNNNHELKANIEFNLEKYLSTSKDVVIFREQILDFYSKSFFNNFKINFHFFK